MLSPIIEKFGNRAEQAGQAMQRKSRVGRLLELSRTQGQVDDVAASRNAMPHTGAAYSGLENSEHDYRESLNRKGEIAGLTSELSGDGPARVQHTYGGTDFAMGPASRSLQRVANPDPGDGDNLDYFGRLAEVQGAQAATEQRRTAAEQQDHLDDPVFAQRRGDIERSQHTQDVMTDADARNRASYSPSAHLANRQKLWNDEERARTLEPFNPNADRYSTQQRIAEINAGAKQGVAETNANARIGSSAVGALARVGGAPTFTPEQNTRADAAGNVIRPLVPGQQPAPADEKVLSMQDLDETAQANGWTRQQAMQEAQRRGYVVR